MDIRIIRIKVIDKLISLLGLTSKDFISYWQRLEVKSLSKQEEKEEIPRYWYQMKVPDIRAQVKLFDYAFEGGKFSSNPKAYPNCQGVVGYINPYANASEGAQILVVLPEQGRCSFADTICKVNTGEIRSGKEATLMLLQHGKKYGLRFQAAEYAINYCKNGIKSGEAFLPSIAELKAVCQNADGVRKALEKIGGTFDGSLWSSTEAIVCGLDIPVAITDENNAQCIDYRYKCSEDRKMHPKMVSCFIAY